MSMPTGRASGLRGTGYKQVTTPTLSPEQQQLFSQLISGLSPGLGQGMSHLAKLAAGGDEQMWSQLEAPAMRQFGQLQGGMASRFSGMGSGARRSSGFQTEMGGAAGDLAERLQSNRLGLQQGAISQLMEMANALLGRQNFETSLVPKQMPFWQSLLLGGVKSLGGGIGSFLGGR